MRAGSIPRSRATHRERLAHRIRVHERVVQIEDHVPLLHVPGDRPPFPNVDLTNRTFNRNIRRVAAVDMIPTPFSPLRSAVLAALRSPASATEVADRLGETRQRVNYHVRALEQAGLVELVEERPRRGCTERVMRATCHAVVVEPRVVGRDARTSRTASRPTPSWRAARGWCATSRPPGRAAAARGQRLLTFAIEAEVGFERPADVERFTDALADRDRRAGRRVRRAGAAIASSSEEFRHEPRWTSRSASRSPSTRRATRSGAP